MIIYFIMEENIFCFYCLQAYSAEEIIKLETKDCFKINGKWRIKMPEKFQNFKLKNFERKIKLPFLIYADFENCCSTRS